MHFHPLDEFQRKSCQIEKSLCKCNYILPNLPSSAMLSHKSILTPDFWYRYSLIPCVKPVQGSSKFGSNSCWWNWDGVRPTSTLLHGPTISLHRIKTLSYIPHTCNLAFNTILLICTMYGKCSINTSFVHPFGEILLKYLECTRNRVGRDGGS